MKVNKTPTILYSGCEKTHATLTVDHSTARTIAVKKLSFFLFLQVTASDFNPFTWDNSSAFVSSYVLSLVLRNHKGESLMVEDSKEDIEIKIKRDGQPNPESVDSFFVKPSSRGEMQYHTIVLPYADGSALRLKVSNAIGLNSLLDSLGGKYVLHRLQPQYSLATCNSCGSSLVKKGTWERKAKSHNLERN